MKQRSEATKNTILSAAREVFLGQGYTAASMDRIALQAEVSKQTLYGYFTDKRALFTNVIEQAIGTPPWELQSPSADILTASQLSGVLYGFAQRINAASMEPNYIKLLRVIVSEAAVQPELGDLFRRGITYRALDAITSLFKRMQAQAVIDVTDPSRTAQLFLGGFVIRIFLDGLLAPAGQIRPQSDEELRAYVDVFVRCIASRSD